MYVWDIMYYSRTEWNGASWMYKIFVFFTLICEIAVRALISNQIRKRLWRGKNAQPAGVPLSTARLPEHDGRPFSSAE
jgi:hypothetical protein